MNLKAAIAFLVSAFVISSNAQEDGSRVWIERPWEFRYILKIDVPSSFSIDRKQSVKQLETPETGRAYRAEAIMPDIKTHIVPNEYNVYENKIATLLMTFNEQAQVTSPYEWPHKLYGRLNRLRYLVLAPGNGPNDLQFRLGEWYTGRSSDEVGYVPAICSRDDAERYKKDFRSSYSTGNFGCREWGYYLQNDEYPYINITSTQWGDDYSKKPNKQGKYPQQLETYIRPVIGWGRFDVPPKPVIGRHGLAWVCLHECPGGDASGIIPDIKAWAAKNGWPIPKVPSGLPLFPDKPRKQGELVD